MFHTNSIYRKHCLFQNLKSGRPNILDKYITICDTEVANKNPILYPWNETQAGRGSIEVASVFIDCLNKACIAINNKKSYSFNINSNVKTVRLFSDECAGLNKNQHIVQSLAYWVFNISSPYIKKVTNIHSS